MLPAGLGVFVNQVLQSDLGILKDIASVSSTTRPSSDTRETELALKGSVSPSLRG